MRTSGHMLAVADTHQKGDVLQLPSSVKRSPGANSSQALTEAGFHLLQSGHTC